ncbi:class I SAM-dependent methyltransferase [Pedobacter sp. Leaf132]|uniref:methyltransferase domain-containing protein n=1 Tax=Pedobacter sp. Leaf132 TaxID=2876557 RepID=UPI001E45C5B1|nr:class I SAM-dependent methyltransferase [Pedobacter sp. Leaf132]
MKKEDLWQIYDNGYASDYNERYLLNPFSKVSSDTEVNVFKKLINKQTVWLDLGCGTGYFLSLFPQIKRAGLDISPKMLEIAKVANPDAEFFKEGDFRVDVPEWHNKWSLISCMWGAYCYVNSVKEVESVVSNIISWNSEGGNVFLPIVDLEDVRPNVTIPYEMQIDVFGGKLDLTSVTWSWLEAGTGIFHEHLVSPHIEHFIKLFQPYYDEIEIIRYPPYMQGWVSRKAILAKSKRKIADFTNLGKVVWQEIPEPAVVDPNMQFVSPLAGITNKNLLKEFLYRIKSGIFLRGLKNRIKYKY